MPFNFDDTPSRQDTYSFKWQKYAGQDIIPAWVADMEFRCAPAILDALSSSVDHGIMGYVLPAQYKPAIEAVQRWLEDKHDWVIDPDWLVWTPGVVPAFNIAIKAYCKPGDKVMVQTPNYPPLLAAPKINGMERVDIGTVDVDGRPTLDFAELETQAADPRCKLLILCNPMNPVGSVLSQQEIDRVAEICLQNDVKLCSDEIHCDLILDETVKHIPAGRVEALKDVSVTLMAASKTFNVAGLGASFAIIPDRQLRQQFVQSAAGHMPWVNLLGLVATEAAFTQCDQWHSELLTYLRGNQATLIEQVNAIDGLKVHQSQATFLAWIDASGLDVANVQKWAESRGVGPSPGADFLAPDHFRINFGCSRNMLNNVLGRLAGKA